MLNLKKLLTKILSKFGYETTYVQNSYGIIRLTKDKATNTVRTYGYFRSATDLDQSTILFTIPSGYRPTNTRATPMMLTTNSNIATSYYGFINADGTVTQQLGNTVRAGFFADEWNL